jgi:hypothetical protein
MQSRGKAGPERHLLKFQRRFEELEIQLLSAAGGFGVCVRGGWKAAARRLTKYS